MVIFKILWRILTTSFLLLIFILIAIIVIPEDKIFAIKDSAQNVWHSINSNTENPDNHETVLEKGGENFNES